MTALASVRRIMGGTPRLGRNLIAQIYSQFVTVAVQLLTVPILIHAWGLETYGVWIVLTALPAYLSLTDFGFTSVAKSDMAMRIARGDRAGARAAFEATFLLLTIVVGIALVLLPPLLFALPMPVWLLAAGAGSTDVRLILGAGVASVLIYQFFLLACAGLRANGHPALETVAAATARAGEAATICLVAVVGGGMPQAAVMAFAFRLLAFVVTAAIHRKLVPWLIPALRRSNLKTMRGMMLPSLSYMLVPLANSLLIQGPIIVMGAFVGPLAAALFSVTRTIARVGMSAANMLNYAFTPEYSFAFGRGDRKAFSRLLRLQTIAVLLGVATYALVAPVIFPYAVTWLGRNNVEADGPLAGIMIVAVIFEVVWTGLFSPLSAVNAHKSAALALAVFSVCAMAAASAFPSTYGLALAILAVHASMLPVAGIVMFRLWKTRIGKDALHRSSRSFVRGSSRGAVGGLLFIAIDAYGRKGGLQAFNRRVIRHLVGFAAEQRGVAGIHLLRDMKSAPELPATHAVASHGGSRLRFLWGSLTQAHASDVILLGHINLLSVGLLAKAISPKAKLVLFVHGIEVWNDPTYRRRRSFEPFMLRFVDRIASVSTYTARRMAAEFRVPAEKFALLPNAVDAVPDRKISAVTQRVVLSVCRMDTGDAAKNLKAVLHAFSRMGQSFADARLEIAGDGVLRASYEALSQQLGLHGRVRFLGSISDQALAEAYARASVFVLPSAKEGFGIVFLEAWSHGLPVICGLDAAAEIVTDGIDGFVVDPADIGALAKRMALLLGDAELAARMGASGAAKVGTRYSDRNFGANLQNLLRGIL